MSDNATNIPSHDEPICEDCANLRKMLKQNHGECWPCAQKRHARHSARVEARREALKAKAEQPKHHNPYILPPLELTTSGAD